MKDEEKEIPADKSNGEEEGANKDIMRIERGDNPLLG
jgi:hypothetical protein